MPDARGVYAMTKPLFLTLSLLAQSLMVLSIAYLAVKSDLFG